MESQVSSGCEKQRLMDGAFAFFPTSVNLDLQSFARVIPREHPGFSILFCLFPLPDVTILCQDPIC